MLVSAIVEGMVETQNWWKIQEHTTPKIDSKAQIFVIRDFKFHFHLRSVDGKYPANPCMNIQRMARFLMKPIPMSRDVMKEVPHHLGFSNHREKESFGPGS